MGLNPLHGITLETIVKQLVEEFGWFALADRIRINCFAIDPSVKSSLTFLRRTPWARKKVEDLYLEMLKDRNELKIPEPPAIQDNSELSAENKYEVTE